MNGRKEKGRFPCHVWKIKDAEEAYEAFCATEIKRYGSEVSLEDGTTLHINYRSEDDYGCRRLCRCPTCGGLILSQSSIDSWDPTDIDADDDYMAVRSPEEAGLLNILLDYGDFYEIPGRKLHAFNSHLCKWTGSGTPVSCDPEELKEKIREKYSWLKPEQKELLEKLMRKEVDPVGGCE